MDVSLCFVFSESQMVQMSLVSLELLGLCFAINR